MLMKMVLRWRLAIPRRMGWAGCAGERKKEIKTSCRRNERASTRAKPPGERRKRQEGHGGKSVREGECDRS